MERDMKPTGLARYLPILSWLPGYSPEWLRFDLVAGLTAAAVVIPQAMAYAAIAGLPVQVGLYTALIPMLLYALLGASRPLSVSTTSTIAMLTAAALVAVVTSSNPADFMIPAATLALLTGVFLLLASILRLGFLANFISLPVLTGFKAGIGVVIFVGQLGKVLGIPVAKGPFLQNILSLWKGLGDIHWLTFTVALSILAILVLLPRLAPRISAPLVAVAAAILAAALFDLGDKGVALVGAIPPGLPAFVASRAGHCPDVIHRIHRCGALLYEAWRPHARTRPGTVCTGDGEHRRRVFSGHASGGRDFANSCECPGWG